MRWLRYSVEGVARYGLVEGDTVVEVTGTPFDDYQRTSRRWSLSSVKIEVPVVPGNFYAAGLNYVEHVGHIPAILGRSEALPKKPDIGYRAASALIAHGEAIVLPRDATANVQYEGELVAVIGKKVKHLAERDALSCVLGYTIGNDVSERTWQSVDRTFWRSKNTDTFKPMGPWIETDVDLDALTTTVRVNGEAKTHFRTNNMLFGIARYISALSQYTTLHPGDVMWMGTDGLPTNIRAGDIVEIEISGVGHLRNPVIRES
jgi:2-keto-4-pentenoate hydratase/2-oxohepta-3-ene-1,7-dioic acid hydratase in catechol pathway